MTTSFIIYGICLLGGSVTSFFIGKKLGVEEGNLEMVDYMVESGLLEVTADD